PTLLSPSACSLHVSTSPEIFALSLHDALPICASTWLGRRLTKHGYGRFYKVGPGPNYTKTDQRALVRFKRKHGFGKSGAMTRARSEEHTSELQSRFDLVCRLLLGKKKPRMHLQ